MKIVSIVLMTVLAHICIVQYAINTKNQLAMSILRDQIQDYAHEIESLVHVKTYEDGLKDGIENAESMQYMRGYHAAAQDRNPFTNIIPSVDVATK